MGCHTWFSVPHTTGKEEIIALAKKYLAETNYISPGHKKMYAYAIQEELLEPVLELAAYQVEGSEKDHIDWVIYKDVEDYSLEQYNIKNNKKIKKYSKEYNKIREKLEHYSDEPRIGGYPETVIRSYDEMEQAMKNGLVGTSYEKGKEEKKIFHFQYEEERKENFMNGIKQFFINHPKGIITFG